MYIPTLNLVGIYFRIYLNFGFTPKSSGSGYIIYECIEFGLRYLKPRSLRVQCESHFVIISCRKLRVNNT